MIEFEPNSAITASLTVGVEVGVAEGMEIAVEVATTPVFDTASAFRTDGGVRVMGMFARMTEANKTNTTKCDLFISRLVNQRV